MLAWAELDVGLRQSKSGATVADLASPPQACLQRPSGTTVAMLESNTMGTLCHRPLATGPWHVPAQKLLPPATPCA